MYALMKKIIPTEVLVWSLLTLFKKKGMGEYIGLFETQTEPVLKLPWLGGMVRAFEACASEISYPYGPTKKGLTFPVDGKLFETWQVISAEMHIFPRCKFYPLPGKDKC